MSASGPLNRSTAAECPGGAHYVAGDWGTTNLRLALVEGNSGRCIKELCGPGIAYIDPPDAQAIVDRLVGELSDEFVHDVLLCGMVGSNLGWVDTGYIDCPARLDRLPQLLHKVVPSASAKNFGSAFIVPGLRCTNPYGSADFMRGEELQVLGALIRGPELCLGEHLICMPGTHCKWAWIDDGELLYFCTALSGELFALLARHSILTGGLLQGGIDQQAFDRGVERSLANPGIDLLHLLFETRSRQLSGEQDASSAASFLSGLIIGRDVSATTNLYAQGTQQRSLVIVGDSEIAEHYQRAASHTEFEVRVFNGNALYQAAMHHIYRLHPD